MDTTVNPTFANGVAYVEGQYLPLNEARIPIIDWGFIRSDVTYDVAHVWQGCFFRLEAHLARFSRSMDRLRMKVMGIDLIREILVQCVALSGMREANVEMICTRGTPLAPDNRDPRYCHNQFYAFAAPIPWIASLEKQKAGLHLVISRVLRIPEASVDPTVKNYHWLDLTAGLFDAYERGGETAVLCDLGGNLVEGPGFNLFLVRDGNVATPDRGMLQGITRRTAMEICRALDIPIEERKVPATEAADCDEAFITSTSGGIMPITRIDGRPLGNGLPGPVTTRIRTAYWDWHEDPRYLTPVKYD